MSKFKHVSGDFVSQYATLMQDLKKEQQRLDEGYERSVRKLLAMETARLEEVAPMPFEPGAIVMTQEGRKGKVLSCPVEISLFEDEEYFGAQYGPGRYINLSDNSDWEEIITCEGMVRRVTVALEPHEIEEDWGHEKIVKTFWPDELAQVK